MLLNSGKFIRTNLTFGLVGLGTAAIHVCYLHVLEEAGGRPSLKLHVAISPSTVIHDVIL